MISPTYAVYRLGTVHLSRFPNIRLTKHLPEKNTIIITCKSIYPLYPRHSENITENRKFPSKKGILPVKNLKHPRSVTEGDGLETLSQ